MAEKREERELVYTEGGSRRALMRFCRNCCVHTLFVFLCVKRFKQIHLRNISTSIEIACIVI